MVNLQRQTAKELILNEVTSHPPHHHSISHLVKVLYNPECQGTLEVALAN